MDSGKFLKECAKRGISLGLDTMTTLMAALGNPQDKIKTIHITGTNGKGSTGAFLEAILRQKGYTVARYTSPAVFFDMEKYTINSLPITAEEFGLCADEVAKACFDEIKPTLFEAETAIAFLYFAKKNCDYAIIEVGMGGREDATNVIKAPCCSIITAISKDHMSFLGDSVELIAKEKCGIIKQGCPVVSAIQLPCAENIIVNAAKEKNARLTFAKEATYKGFDGQRQYFDYDKIENIALSALGTYQLQNAAVAIEAAKVLGDFSKKEFRNALKDVIWHGRFEVISHNPTFIIDGAHNEAGALALCDSIKRYFKDCEINFITATFSDKEYQKTAEILAPMAKQIFATSTPNSRGLASQDYAKAISVYNNHTYNSTVQDAVAECIDDKSAITVCFGTLSFLAKIRQEVENSNGKSE